MAAHAHINLNENFVAVATTLSSQVLGLAGILDLLLGDLFCSAVVDTQRKQFVD